MENLPDEVVEEISTHLTPEDLARCCAVSTVWREIFNKDCLWKPRCDPAQEEHLSSTPSIVEPKFVTPGGEDSTLSPISRWRLAFLRAKHLLNNWKNNNYKKGPLFPNNSNRDECYRQFLTNNLLVRVLLARIEIWDVNLYPPVLVIQTDPSVIDIKGGVSWYVIEGNRFAVKMAESVKIFSVDVTNSCIHLKCEIPVYRPQFFFTKRHCIHVSMKRLQLDICDLETGEKVMEDDSLVRLHQERNSNIVDVIVSPTNDYVVVVVDQSEPGYKFDHTYYVYCTRRLNFLPGTFTNKSISVSRSIMFSPRAPESEPYCELHGHYIAIRENEQSKITIYNLKTREAFCQVPPERGFGFYCSEGRDYYAIIESLSISLNSYELKFLMPGSGMREGGQIKMFSLSSKTWTTTVIKFDRFSYHAKIFNRKMIVVEKLGISLWGFDSDCQRLSLDCHIFAGNAYFNCDISFGWVSIINNAMSKVVSNNIYHYW